MAANGKVERVGFTVIKSTKKHGVESHARSKVSPVVAVVPASTESLDTRVVSNSGIDYINDTLQVKCYCTAL